MTIYRFELTKLLSSVAVWGFMAACLLWNLFLAAGGADLKYANFVGSAARDTGYRLEPSFDEKLSQLAIADERAEEWERLWSETAQAADVFEGYATTPIGERYIAAAKATGWFAEQMRDKYAALQHVVDEKAARDESLTLYFAGATHTRHQALFNGLMGWLLLEGMVLSALLALLSAAYEKTHGTEALVYATKTGRRILGAKTAASLTAGLGAFVLLALLTLLVYFSVHPYGGIWGSSVSSLFNYRYDVIAGLRPFVTWHSLTVLTYLAAMIGVTAGLTVCLSLMAFSIGLWIRNPYTGFLVLLAANAILVALPMQMPGTLTASLYVKFYSMLSPVWLWLKHSLWFTDGDIDILWPHFESLGLGVSLLVLTILRVLAGVYFRKRDLT